MWETKPNTAYIAKSFGREALAKDGCVRVRPTLQLPDHPEIFALGDMVDWPEVKQALKAIAHAKIVIANVLSYLKDKPLKSYGGSHEALMLTGGKVSILLFPLTSRAKDSFVECRMTVLAT